MGIELALADENMEDNMAKLRKLKKGKGNHDVLKASLNMRDMMLVTYFKETIPEKRQFMF